MCDIYERYVCYNVSIIAKHPYNKTRLLPSVISAVPADRVAYRCCREIIMLLPSRFYNSALIMRDSGWTL
jgi:hypothetical protein